MEHETKHIGRGMTIAAWILLLVLLSIVFNQHLEKQYNPNQEVTSLEDEQSRSIELRRNRMGHYVASGQINDKNVTFLLDTGATDVSIPESVAKKLHLEKGFASQVQTANGVITVYATILDKVQLGNILLHDIRAHINPYMQGNEILLGMSFLKQLEFSQQGDKLTIQQPYF